MPSSASISATIRRRSTLITGYVNAFRHPDLARAIGSGARGLIAVSYLEWAGPHDQRVVMPWTIIGSYGDARRFADGLANEPIRLQAGTSISGALVAAGDLFAKAPRAAVRRVIDNSGDGPNNAGPAVAPIRNLLTASGIVINGLPLSLPQGLPNGFQSFDAHYLDLYYVHCVIGGPDAFVIGVEDLALFEVAIRRKLLLEIAGVPPLYGPASYSLAGGPVFDCSMIGTNARQRRQGRFTSQPYRASNRLFRASFGDVLRFPSTRHGRARAVPCVPEWRSKAAVA